MNLIRDAVGAVPTPPDAGTVSVEARFAELARRHADVDIDELTDDTASASTESLAVARLALDNIAGQLAVLDRKSVV